MKLHFIDEPALVFSGDQEHIDIRAGMAKFGAFDKSGPSIPRPIRVGLIGTTATLDRLRDWIETCKGGVISEEKKLVKLRPSFPGMTEQVFGTTIELSDANTRAITRHELTAAMTGEDRLRNVVSVFVAHAKDLAGKSGLNVLVVAPPPEVFALGDSPSSHTPEGPIDDSQDSRTKEESSEITRGNFHDLFKAEALRFQVPCQIIRPDTYGDKSSRDKSRRMQDEATRAWNFHTAIYYKAGGVPWRLARAPASLSTCHVGVSFYRSVAGDKLMTSVAQIFDERGEGLVVQGGNASYDKEDRTPHLTADDARDLLAAGLATYKREHKNMPARLVLHKTSYFNQAEKEGFQEAADSERLEVLDLVSIRRSETRVLKAAESPMTRGTALLFDEKSGLVYLKGTVPYFEVYPGAYIPRALEFSRDDGESNAFGLAREIVGLSKLNFNNTQFDTGDPITIRAARRVGDILKHVSAEQPVNARFRYFT
jgi:hypothetical protein